MTKQLFFKLKGQKLCPLSKREQKYFAENMDIDVEKSYKRMFTPFVNLEKDEIYVSFAFSRTENDILVYIWAGNYSIALTRKEFMILYNILSDKDNIENMIIANGI